MEMLSFSEDYLQSYQELKFGADSLTFRKEYCRGGLIIRL